MKPIRKVIKIKGKIAFKTPTTTKTDAPTRQKIIHFGAERLTELKPAVLEGGSTSGSIAILDIKSILN